MRGVDQGTAMVGMWVFSDEISLPDLPYLVTDYSRTRVYEYLDITYFINPGRT